MRRKSKKDIREKDITSRYLAGDMDTDEVEGQERFSKRSKFHQANKTARTAAQRIVDAGDDGEIGQLPLGQVVQVYSLYLEVLHEGQTYLCVVRKTLGKVTDTRVVVGDRVRFRPTGTTNEAGQPEGSIERIEPRDTILARAESFKGLAMDPIVANAQQMLIVASVWAPFPRWGLIDRMIIAATAGKLQPIVCLNKIDLARSAEAGSEPANQHAFATDALAHYERLGVRTLQTSVNDGTGLDALRQILAGNETVLAGHSGVGKSSLIRGVQPHLDIRIGEVSEVTIKGKHTTTSARRYPLDMPEGGAVIDTPGVKQFGLWGVTQDNVLDFFLDVADGTAPQWRIESYDRIRESVPDDALGAG